MDERAVIRLMENKIKILTEENKNLKYNISKIQDLYDKSQEKYSDLYKQYQQCCIEKNQLMTTVDILVDRYSNLRNITGMNDIYAKHERIIK